MDDKKLFEGDSAGNYDWHCTGCRMMTEKERTSYMPVPFGFI